MEEAGTVRRIISVVVLTAGAAALLLFLAVSMGFSSHKQHPIQDENLQKYVDEIRSFLPRGIPAAASDVTWRYFRHEPFPCEFAITLSMRLPENEYRVMKKMVLEEADMPEDRKGKGMKVTVSPAGRGSPEMTIRFDDDRYWIEFVRYIGGNDASDWNM